MPELLRVVKCHVAVLLLACTTLAAADDRVEAQFFFTPACRMCKETKDAVRRAEAHFGEKLRVEWVDMSQAGTNAARRLFELLDAYGFDKTVTPELALFAGNTCLAGPEAIIDGIVPAIDRELAGLSARRRAVRVDRMSLWAVSAAGLVDGVNPCAFATVVLLVSMMAAAGKSRHQTLAMGAVFTLAVFLTYFLVGLFFYHLLQGLSGFLVISDLVYYLAFGLCVAFALLSVHDAVLIRRGKPPTEMLLKLPDSLRDRMRKHMRIGVHSAGLLAGVFSAGVVVSLLESACTGQVYFPAIAGLSHSGEPWRALRLLLWYNLLFILPLVGVFVATFFGVTSERLAGLGRRNVGTAKFLLALVFLAMAAWMWPALVWPPGTR